MAYQRNHWTQFADEAATILAHSARKRGLDPDLMIVAAMRTVDVELSKLIPPDARPFADPGKLQRHGRFDWSKYSPIIVETDGTHFWLMDGMTRVENARRAGIAVLPAYVFTRK